MNRRASAYVVAILLMSGSALLAPPLGWASSGGASSSGGGALGAGAGAPPTRAGNAAGLVQRGDAIVTASGDGITIATQASAMLRHQARFTGNVSPASAGHVVEIERLGRQTHWAWAPTVHGTVLANGSFSAEWSANHIGRFAIRAVTEGVGGRRPHAAEASPTLTLTVYRPAIATQYGPGFYGQRTACGQKLRSHMLGIASRTLKCGTEVAIYYRGRTLVVPVIDRGPYANHADWDLTEATGRALGIDGTATIGAVSLPSR